MSLEQKTKEYAGELVGWYASKMQNKRLNRSMEIASSKTHRNDGRLVRWYACKGEDATVRHVP